MEETSDIISPHQTEFYGRDIDISDTPISPMSLDDDDTPILFTDNVVETYKKLVTMINVPETAKEYSFVLLGRSAKILDNKCYMIDQIVDCSLGNTNLSNRETKIDNSKLNLIINKALEDGYDFISIGHTHPNISNSEKQLTIANYLSEDVKKREYIRDSGLNLSLQNFVSYESLYDYFNKNSSIKTSQTVIMYNGEIAMFGKQNNSLNRMVMIMDMTTGEDLYVSKKDTYMYDKQVI